MKEAIALVESELAGWEREIKQPWASQCMCNGAIQALRLALLKLKLTADVQSDTNEATAGNASRDREE